MKRFSVLAFLLAMFIISSCFQKQEKEQYLTYNNSNLGFTLNYPSAWEKAEVEGMFVFFQSPEDEGFITSLSIFFDEENTDILTKTQKDFYDENKDSIPDFKILDFTKTLFAGEECIITTYDSNGDDGEIRQKQYILNHNGKLYMLIFTALQKNYEKYEVSFDKMADSFAFIY